MGLWGIFKANMNAPLVISVLSNSPGLQFFAVIQGGGGGGLRDSTCTCNT